MFLLNSRTPLVTAPWARIYTNTSPGTPYTEDTGLICWIPLTRFSLHTLGFSPRGTCAGSGYEYLWSFLFPFSRAPSIVRIPQKDTRLRITQVLIVTILPWLVLIIEIDNTRLISSMRQKTNLCYHAYISSIGILTDFPFPLNQVMIKVRID